MYKRISLKDVVAVNQRFDRGHVVNGGSLDFALGEANRSKSWLRACAVLVRAVLIDHVFEEGNKRTAAAIMMSFFEESSLSCDPDRVAKGIVRILERNITSLTEIEKVIADAILR